MLRTTHRHPTVPGPVAGPRHRVRRATRRTLALAAVTVLAAPGAALLAAPAAAAPAAAPAAVTTGMTTGVTTAAVDGACTDAAGVTVVVDSTALGGGVEVGCAPEGGVTGTEALLAAGFTEVRDPGGFICAIDGLPDPCPTEFTGSYWSYWSAEAGADAWVTYQEGSDTAVTVPGAVEGWRYGDGSEGPAVALPIVAATEPAAEETPAEEGGPEEETPDAATQDDAAAVVSDDEAQGPAVPLLVGLGLLAALAVAAVVVARRRSVPDADATDTRS